MTRALPLLTTALTAASALAQPVATNLVVNGDAETGDTSGWVTADFVVVPSAGSTGGFGAWTFTPGEGPELGQRMTQDIAITTLGPAIDAGLARADFSLVIQSRSDASLVDTGTATLEFRTALGSLLDSNSFTDPPVPSTTWDVYGVVRVIPAETRIIRIVLEGDRNGGVSTDCYFDAISLRIIGCSDADLAEPLGSLDFSDVVAFLTAFGAMDPAADLAEPMGSFDFSDVVAFLTAFGAGCP